MIRTLWLPLFLAMSWAMSVEAQTVKAPGDTVPAIERPTGSYQMAWLTLEGAGEPVEVFLSLRDGKPAQFWSTNVLLPGTPKSNGQLKLLVDELRGETKGETITAAVVLRLVSTWAPMKTFASITLDLNLTIKGDELVGSFNNRIGDQQTKGKVTGKLATETALAKTDALAKDQDWPSFYGQVTSGHAATYGKQLVTDISKARPLWRSEGNVLSGWGTGADSRYPSRAAYGTLCGGSSSPVVSDGLIYVYHYIPSGDFEPKDKDAEIVAKFDHPKEKDAMLRFYSKRADIVVTCIDAVTGKTVWQFRWPMRQGNYQTHKWRGLNPTPAIGHGVLVFVDYSWGLHALNAKTGALLWTRGGGGPVPHNSGTVGPVIAGKTVVFTTAKETVGLDLETGKELWKAPGGASPRRVVVAGKDRVLVFGPASTLLDPATGAILWKSDFATKDKICTTGPLPIANGDRILVHNIPDSKKQMGQTLSYKITDAGIEQLWINEPIGPMEDSEMALIASHGLVFATHDDALRVIDAETGKTLKSFDDLPAGSNCNLIAVDNFILYQPECQHGRQYPNWLEIQGKEVTVRTKAWRPPHNDTTAYGNMPITNVIVDGRLVLRGMDGIYCYDLRAKK